MHMYVVVPSYVIGSITTLMGFFNYVGRLVDNLGGFFNYIGRLVDN